MDLQILTIPGGGDLLFFSFFLFRSKMLTLECIKNTKNPKSPYHGRGTSHLPPPPSLGEFAPSLSYLPLFFKYFLSHPWYFMSNVWSFMTLTWWSLSSIACTVQVAQSIWTPASPKSKTDSRSTDWHWRMQGNTHAESETLSLHSSSFHEVST